MRKFALAVLALALSGCVYFRSFQGPPNRGDDPVVGVRSGAFSKPCAGPGGGGFRTCGGESITVVVLQSERTFPYCSLLANGITCEFPSAYLLNFANMEAGGWASIQFTSAQQVCYDAMHTVPRYPDAINQCAWFLVELRWREAMPPEPGREE